MWGLALLAVLNCTTVVRGVLTHAPSYQLGVCVCECGHSPMCHTHTHLHSVPRLNPALTVDRGGGHLPPTPPASDNPSKPPCLEQKEPVVAVAYFSFKAVFLLLSISHSLFLSLALSDPLKTIFLFFYALTRNKKKKRIDFELHKDRLRHF